MCRWCAWCALLRHRVVRSSITRAAVQLERLVRRLVLPSPDKRRQRALAVIPTTFQVRTVWLTIQLHRCYMMHKNIKTSKSIAFAKLSSILGKTSQFLAYATACLACYAIARPSVRPSHTVESGIVQFSPYGSAITLVFNGVSFIQKFWRVPLSRSSIKKRYFLDLYVSILKR